MANNTHELRDLVADAKRIIAYATRNGTILPMDFLGVTFLMEDKLAHAQEISNDEKVSFVKSLNVAANVIRPVTLIDLGSRWRPFAAGQNSVLVRAAMSLLAILVIGAAGYYTNLYVVASEALSELNNIQSQGPADKAARLFRMYIHNPRLVTDMPGESDDMHYEPFLRAKEDLLNLDANILTTQTEVFRLNNQFNLFNGLKSLWKESTSAPSAKSTATITAPKPAADATGSAEQGDKTTRSDHPQNEEDFLIYIGAPNVDLLVDPVSSASSSNLPFLIETVRELVESLGTLILPTLFGMIGTIVFEMRRMLNPMAPNDPVERMLVRTALGGLAGLSITFVLKPLHILQGDSTYAGMGVFAIAFLLGFSIDMFFSTLDKMVTTISQWISGAARA